MWTFTGALLLSFYIWSGYAQSQDGDALVPESGPKKSVWDDPIQFVTKAKDQCFMLVTGQGEMTKLRVSCQGPDGSYWCDFQGQPHVCRQYNANPRHYFTQIMWELRKQRNACTGQSVLRPIMCKKAPEVAQMAFVASSEMTPGHRSVQPNKADSTQSPTTKQDNKPANSERMRRPQARPNQPRPEQGRQEQVRPNSATPRPAGPSTFQTTKSQPVRPVHVKLDQSSRSGPGKAVSQKPRARSTTTTTSTTSTVTPTPTPIPSMTTAKHLAKQHCWSFLQSTCTHVIGWFTK